MLFLNREKKIKEYLFKTVFIVLSVAVVGKIIYIKTVQRDFLETKKENQIKLPVVIRSERGKILDRNKYVLAESKPTFTIYSDSRYIEDKKNTAKILSEFFKLNEEEVLNKLNKTYAVIMRNVDSQILENFKKLKLKGIMYYRSSQRVYPNNSMFGKVLGFVGDDGEGLYGLELKLNNYLKGIDGIDLTEKDIFKRTVNYIKQVKRDAVDGYDVVLTIDKNLQYQVERILKEGVEQAEAKKGIAIVMNPNTGEVLALADYPQYDPNNYKQYNKEDYKIPSIGMCYEPGSTFKSITFSIAEDLGLIKKNERFLDNNNFYVDGHRIKAWNNKGFGYMTPEEVLINSSNAGIAQIGLKIPLDYYISYLKKYGLTQKTGIEIAGEERPIIQSKEQLKKNIVRANMSMGQGIAITPIQLATAYCTLINGGKKVTPHILDKVIDKEGNVIYQTSKQLGEQVIKETTSKRVREILKMVVDKGTGRKAKIDGYTIGGKTGTAQKAENGIYVKGKYIVSFASFTPVDKPQYFVLVVIDEPSLTSGASGGTVAAPINRKILEFIFDYYKFEENKKGNTEEKDDKLEEITVENYLYRPIEYINKIKNQLNIKTDKNEGIVVNQKYKSTKNNLEIELELDNFIKNDYFIVPNFYNLTYLELLNYIKKLPNIEVKGNTEGVVVYQNLKPGTKVNIREKLIIMLK